MTTSVELSQSPSNPIVSRGALLVAMFVAWFSVIAFYAGYMWMSVISVVVTDGLLVAMWVTGATALGHLLHEATRLVAGFSGSKSEKNIATSRVASLEKPNRVLILTTCAAIGLGAFSLIALVLGLLGALDRVTTIAMPVVAVVMWIAIVGRKKLIHNDDASARISSWLKQPAGWHAMFLTTAPMLGVATVAAAMVPGFMWKPDDPHPYDVVSYHLQIPREWHEMGQIVPLTHNVFSYFPFNVEMQFLLGMHLRGGAWEGMYFAQLMSLAYGLLAVAAVYGVARLFTDRGWATLAAVVVATMPWVPMLSSVAYVESALLLYTTLALGWMLRAVFMEKTAMPRAAVIAGVCAGLACGVKLTAGPMLLAPLVVAVCAVSFKRGFGRAVIASVIFGVVAMVVLSPWLIRNAMWTGNPFFPNATGVFGPGHWLPEQIERYKVAHTSRAGLLDVLPRVWREIVFHWQYGYVLVPFAIAGLVRAIFCSRSGATGCTPPVSLFAKLASTGGVPPVAPAEMVTSFKQSRVAWVMAIIITLQLVFWLTTHAIGRFMLIGVPMLALLVAMNSGRRWRPIAAVLVVGAMIVGLVHIHPRLERFSEMGRQGVFGMVDVGFIQPQELQDLYDTGAAVHFVGDAQVFLHKAKMSQLRYRGVFDVMPGTDDPITAWTGKPLNELPAGEWVLIDPAEIGRLSRTYRHVPAVPASYPGPRDTPYLMDREGRVIVPRR